MDSSVALHLLHAQRATLFSPLGTLGHELREQLVGAKARGAHDDGFKNDTAATLRRPLEERGFVNWLAEAAAGEAIAILRQSAELRVFWVERWHADGCTSASAYLPI